VIEYIVFRDIDRSRDAGLGKYLGKTGVNKNGLAGFMKSSRPVGGYCYIFAVGCGFQPGSRRPVCDYCNAVLPEMIGRKGYKACCGNNSARLPKGLFQIFKKKNRPEKPSEV
jgi:hypothetical protein